MSTPLDRIADYLESPNASPYYVNGSAVDRTVRVRHEQWPWLLDGHINAGSSRDGDIRPRSTGSVQDGVQAALAAIKSNDDKIDAQSLREAAVGVRADDPTSLVRAWFLIMAWGAGDRNNYRVRQWTKALDDGDRLVHVLTTTANLAAAGDLAGAYRAAPLPGFGESFFTKWLWLISHVTPGPHGYVYDNRVRATLRLLGWRSDQRSLAGRWVDYSETIERWSAAINERHEWHTTPDHVEQMLFHRSLKDQSHRTLYAHLQQPATNRVG